MEILYENRFRALAIDPSTSHSGFAIIDLDITNGSINIPFTTTLHRSDLIRGRRWMCETHGDKETAIYCYGKALHELLEIWEPMVVVIESPYLSRLPAAFKALSEITNTFTQTVMEWDVTIPIVQIDPATIKKGMGVSGKSGDKNDMLQALLNTTLPISYTNVDINAIDEHSVDAICGGLMIARDMWNY